MNRPKQQEWNASGSYGMATTVNGRSDMDIVALHGNETSYATPVITMRIGSGWLTFLRWTGAMR
jgi:hypothetical protein